MSWYYREYYPPATPIEVRGGIRAQTRRGNFGQNWWAKRWIETLESFHIGARLSRGRSYARKGQVISIDVRKGVVLAKVQGTRSKPYEIVIRMKEIAKRSWKKVAKLLSGRILYVAQLLNGEMPMEIEEKFKEAGVSLFPSKRKDLNTSCTCPDWSNPCKHIAAVFYLLGEEFDRDPFLIFKLRGKTREELVDLMGVSSLDRGDAADETITKEEEKPDSSPEPLTSDVKAFWKGQKHAGKVGDEQENNTENEKSGPPVGNAGKSLNLPAGDKNELSDNLFGEIKFPHVTAALPKRLGNFPFWRGGENFLNALKPIYYQSSRYAMDIIMGNNN